MEEEVTAKILLVIG